MKSIDDVVREICFRIKRRRRVDWNQVLEIIGHLSDIASETDDPDAIVGLLHDHADLRRRKRMRSAY